MSPAPLPSKTKLLDQVRDACRVKHRAASCGTNSRAHVPPQWGAYESIVADYTARGHKLRFSVIPACFWRESRNPISVTH